MRCILLNSGISLLQSQAADSNSRIRIYGFEVGDRVATQVEMELWDNVEPSLDKMMGNIVLQADETYTRWSRETPQRGQLVIEVPESVAQINLANIVVLAGLNSETVRPFLFCANPNTFVKLQAVPTGPGYAWWAHLMFEIPNLETRMSFDNLSSRYADFEVYPTENDLAAPWATPHDQLVVESHSAHGLPSPILNVGYRFWGCPLILPFDDNTAPVFSGGTYGDSYQDQ